MAEILGTIGSIIGLVDTALKAREYIKDFHNAPGEQKKLFTDMEDLKPLLVELEKRVSNSPSTSTLQQITSPLARFNTVLEGFTAKVRPADGRWSKFSKQLTWTLWNKKEAKEYLDEFENIKSLISVWLAVDILYVSLIADSESGHSFASGMSATSKTVNKHSATAKYICELMLMATLDILATVAENVRAQQMRTSGKE
jgi:hypothetical protein